jgi:hypothetical protein
MAPSVTTSRIALGDLTPNNIGQLRVLNSTLFPVNYSDKFYKEVLEVGEFAKLGNVLPFDRRSRARILTCLLTH